MCFLVPAGAAAGALQVSTGMTAATVAAINMALVTAATTAATMSQQQKQQKVMAEWQQKQSDLQGEVSRTDAISKYAALQDRSREREVAQGSALMENRRKALEAQSMTSVMAAEGGVQGTSVGLLLGDLERQNQDYQTAVLQQEDFQEAQYIRESQAVEAGHYASILAAAPSPIPEPDYLGGLLGIGASSYGTYLGVKHA